MSETAHRDTLATVRRLVALSEAWKRPAQAEAPRAKLPPPPPRDRGVTWTLSTVDCPS